MSQDFQIAWPCPHLIIEEPVSLASDRRTLDLRQPIASINLVRVLVNNEFYIPANGLLSPASLTGASSGPFNISSGSKSITISSSSETVTFSLPVGLRITVDKLIKLFNASLTNIVAENVGGHLTFTDAYAVGSESRLRVTGSAASSIGFADQSASRGHEVFPPWKLIKKLGTLDASDTRVPQFLRPVKASPTFKATYAVQAQRCLRCGGTFVENDYRIDIQGDPIVIRDENLLYQAALKILLTRKGSNPYNPWYGTNITSRIGMKALGATATLINEDVRTALAGMQRLQAAQSKFQAVSIKERLYSVLAANVRPHTQDPTVFLVDVTVSNGSGQPIRLDIVFTVPGAVALMGSNGLSLFNV